MIFRMIIVCFFMVYLQRFVAPLMGVGNTVPNLLLPLVLYYGGMRKKTGTLIIAFFLGLILDMDHPETFGISTLLFVIIAFILGEIQEKFNREHLSYLVVIISLLNFLYFFISILVFNIAQGKISLPIMPILLVTFQNIAYSGILFFLFYCIDSLKISFHKMP